MVTTILNLSAQLTSASAWAQALSSLGKSLTSFWLTMISLIAWMLSCGVATFIPTLSASWCSRLPATSQCLSLFSLATSIWPNLPLPQRNFSGSTWSLILSLLFPWPLCLQCYLFWMNRPSQMDTRSLKSPSGAKSTVSLFGTLLLWASWSSVARQFSTSNTKTQPRRPSVKMASLLMEPLPKKST